MIQIREAADKNMKQRRFERQREKSKNELKVLRQEGLLVEQLQQEN